MGPRRSLSSGAHSRDPLAGTTAPSSRAQQKARAYGPGFFRQCERLDQAAGWNSFDALVLIGSAVSVATFLASSASSLALAVKVSNCDLACEDHSSIASEGDLTPISAWAKSRLAVVLDFMISISLAEYSLAPLLALENTASMVPLWLSATSLNLA